MNREIVQQNQTVNPEPVIDINISLPKSTRRDFIKRTGGWTLAVLVGAPIIAACEPKPDFIGPRTESERKVENTVKVYKEVIKNEHLTPTQAVSVTRGILGDISPTSMKEIMDTANFAKEQGETGSLDRALGLVVSARIANKSYEEAIRYYRIAAAHPGINEDLDQAVGLAGLGLAVNDLGKVLNMYDRIVSETDVKHEDSMIFLTTWLMNNNFERSKDVYESAGDGLLTLAVEINARKFESLPRSNNLQVSSEGFQNHGDLRSVMQLYAEFLDGGKLSDFSAKIMTLASAIYDFDYVAVAEMYNFAGQIDEIDQETAAELVLETVSADEGKMPIMIQDENGNIIIADANDPRVAKASSGGGYIHHYYPYNYYGGSSRVPSSSYRVISSTNSQKLAPASRLAPPARSTAPGKGFTSSSGLGSGGRGGVSVGRGGGGGG